MKQSMIKNSTKFPRALAATLLGVSLFFTPAQQCLSLDNNEARGKLRIEFSSSEPCGLLRFVEGISGQTDEGKGYSEFLASHYKLNKLDKKLIRDYQWFRKAKREFEIPTGRKLELIQKLMVIASSTKSFDEFFKLAEPCCSEDEFQILQQVMNHFRPLYEQLIWKPLSPQLNKDLGWFRTNEQEFSRPLETVAKLFQSSAGRSRPLRAILVPVPTEVTGDGKGFTFSTSAFSENLDLGIILSQGIIPPDVIAGFHDPRVNNDRALEDSDGLIHEFTHMLWAFRSPEFNKALVASFEKADRQFNYDLLNESQAAAIQAWFHKQVHGKDKTGRWYDNKYVDKYAKALLPILMEYASSSSPASINADDYAQKAMKAFDETFPNWQEDPQIILWRSQLVQSPLSSEDLADDLNNHLFDFVGGNHKVVLVKGETWPAKFANASKNPKMTTAFLLYKNQTETLQKYFGISENIVRDLKELENKNKDSEAALVKAVKSGQQWYVFSIASKQAAQKQGLLDYAAAKPSR